MGGRGLPTRRPHLSPSPHGGGDPGQISQHALSPSCPCGSKAQAGGGAITFSRDQTSGLFPYKANSFLGEIHITLK